MINWFEIFADRLSAIEERQEHIVSLIKKIPINTDGGLYGDFKWLVTIYSGVPESTLRIKSSAGEIPGVVKVGKRVLYNKEIVLGWLASQTSTLSRGEQAAQDIEKAAEAQFNARHQLK